MFKTGYCLSVSTTRKTPYTKGFFLVVETFNNKLSWTLFSEVNMFACVCSSTCILPSTRATYCLLFLPSKHGQVFSFSFGCLLFHCGYYGCIPYILQLVSICVHLHLFIASHDASSKKWSLNPVPNLNMLHGLIIDIEYSNSFCINIYSVPLHFLVHL